MTTRMEMLERSLANKIEKLKQQLKFLLGKGLGFAVDGDRQGVRIQQNAANGELSFVGYLRAAKKGGYP